MLALPVIPAVGVKVALRVKPVPLMAPKLPPLTSTLPCRPSQAKLAPGSSVKVKVTTVLWPMPSLSTAEVIARLGANVSTVIVRVPARPRLPAASVALALSVSPPSAMAVRSVGVKVYCQAPRLSALRLWVFPPSTRLMVVPGSARPLMTEDCSAALTMLSMATVLITGASGATVSSSNTRSVGTPTLPARSVAVALIVSLPWPMAVTSAASRE